MSLGRQARSGVNTVADANIVKLQWMPSKRRASEFCQDAPEDAQVFFREQAGQGPVALAEAM